LRKRSPHDLEGFHACFVNIRDMDSFGRFYAPDSGRVVASFAKKPLFDKATRMRLTDAWRLVSALA